ncbi:MAG TPA: hypothetical protein PK115_05950, partial [Bacteroidales bacterium]|nr:hypothetical protein [Bacteroidales bacterium]
EYLWSSYHFHFSKRNHLEKYINIDTEFINRIYPDRKSLDSAIINYKADLGEIKEKGNDIWTRTTDGLVINCLKILLGDRIIYQISDSEMIDLIISLRKESGASYRQIASVTHQSYEFVRRTLWRSLR